MSVFDDFDDLPTLSVRVVPGIPGQRGPEGGPPGPQGPQGEQGPPGEITDDRLSTSIIGRSQNSAGVAADIQIATNGHVLQRSGNTLVGDYVRNSNVAVPATAADGVAGTKLSFLQGGTGAVYRSTQDKQREIVSVLDFGALGDNSTNDTAAFTAAFTYSKSVFVPIGTYLANIVIPNGGQLIGQHRDLTIIKAPAGTTSHAIVGYEAFTLFGTSTFDTSRGANDTLIRNLTVDGNRANVTTAGNGISIWGYGTKIECVRVKNCRSRGIHTEWTDGNASMEGHFTDIIIDTTGTTGFYFCGPHDAHCDHIRIIDASQNTDDTSYGLYAGSGGGGSVGNGRFFNIHVWHRSGITKRVNFAVYSQGTNEFSQCHFEGGRRLLRLGALDRVSGSLIYAYFGANNDSMVYLGGNSSIMTGCTFLSAEGAANPGGSVNPNPDCTALYFGSAAANIISGCYFQGFKTRTPFNFDTSAGANAIVGCFGYASPGGGTTFQGTVNVADHVEYVQGGTAVNYRKPTLYASAANDAAAASAGVPLNGYYENSSTRALTRRAV